jgi:hypothetical protein
MRLRLTAPRGQHRKSPCPSLIDDSGLESALANAGLSHQADNAAPHIDAVQAIAETTELLGPAQQQSTARHRYSLIHTIRAARASRASITRTPSAVGAYGRSR